MMKLHLLTVAGVLILAGSSIHIQRTMCDFKLTPEPRTALCGKWVNAYFFAALNAHDALDQVPYLNFAERDVENEYGNKITPEVFKKLGKSFMYGCSWLSKPFIAVMYNLYDSKGTLLEENIIEIFEERHGGKFGEWDALNRDTLLSFKLANYITKHDFERIADLILKGSFERIRNYPKLGIDEPERLTLKLSVGKGIKPE